MLIEVIAEIITNNLATLKSDIIFIEIKIKIMKDMIQTFKWKWNSNKLEFIGTILSIITLGIFYYFVLNICY
jgi:hypothetical protein